MRRIVEILSFLIVSTIAAPLPATAATWSAPVDVSSPSTFVDNPFVGFGRSGTGLAAWRWQDGVGSTALGGVRVASESSSGAFGPERPAPEALAPPVVYGSDRVLLVGEQAVIRHRRERDRIQVAFGRTDGSFAATRTLETIQTFGIPAVAANDSGRVAVAYLHFTRHHRTVRLALGRHERFGRPRVVSRRIHANRVAVAVGRRGDVVVAWERGGRIEARIRRPGHRFGRVVLVGRGAKLHTQLRAAVAASGRVWIAWSSQLLTEGGESGPFTLQNAVSARRHASFHRPRELDRYDRRALDEATFDLALDGNGNGFVTWSSFDGANFRAKLAFANAEGRFIRQGILSTPGYDAAVGDLATSRLIGEALVVWARLDAVGEVGNVVFAGYRAPTGIYTGEEEVSRGDRARKPAAAFNPRTGLPTVVWSQRQGPDGPGVPLRLVKTFLRASIRSP